MSLIDNKVLGIQGKILIGVAGTTPTVALSDETEANLNCDNDMAGYATRGQRRKNNRCTTQDLSVDFTVVKDFTNPSFKLLYAAAMSGSPLAAKLLDNTSGYGWDGDWVFNKKEGQPLDGWTTVQFEGKFNSDQRALIEIVLS